MVPQFLPRSHLGELPLVSDRKVFFARIDEDVGFRSLNGSSEPRRTSNLRVSDRLPCLLSLVRLIELLFYLGDRFFWREITIQHRHNPW